MPDQRQAAAPKGCDVRSIMRRDVAESLNRDHRALHPVLAQNLCGRAYQPQLKYESAQRKRQLDRLACNGAIALPN